MPKWEGYVVYQADKLPRKGCDKQEAAWTKDMKPMAYNFMSDACAAALKRSKETKTNYSVYQSGSSDPIASTAQWACIDKMLWIHN